MKGNPVVHFEIYAQNIERAKEFYENVFEITLEKIQSPIPEVEMEMWSFPVNNEAPMTSYGAGGIHV